MCGILGTINYPVKEKKDIVFKELFHRGPDEQNLIVFDSNLEFFHTRLAIQELSAQGRQPMSYNGIHIIFNGEIYNHKDLRERYKLSHSGQSDTMTILLMYELKGLKMLDDFDGMFAFCLYDEKIKKIFLVRDRAGIKPLFLWNDGNSFIFSSELNVLKKILPLSLNRQSVSDFLYVGYNFRAATPYEKVSEVENGTIVEIDLVNFHFKKTKWYHIAAPYWQKSFLAEDEALFLLDEKLKLAVSRRILSSDLEVGCFLSGGIDSGLVTAIAVKHSPSLRSFIVRFPGAYDESELAALVAQKYHTNHTVIDVSFDNLQADFEKIIFNYGEPFFDSSAIPSYYVSREARKHITVVLNGDGADELFGGYRRYLPFRYFDFFNVSNNFKSFSASLLKLLPVSHEKKNIYNYFYRLFQFTQYHDPADVYNAATIDLFVGYKDKFIQKPCCRALVNMLNEIKIMPISPLKKILLADFNAILFSDLLPKMDIATMANSLEGRSPFLSNEFLDFAPSLHDNYKINKFTTKYLLRKLAVKYLPAELINQPKRGFEVPLKRWIENDLNELLNDYLFHSSNRLFIDFIDEKFIQDLYEKKVQVSDEKRAKMLYSILCLEIWYKNAFH